MNTFHDIAVEPSSGRFMRPATICLCIIVVSSIVRLLGAFNDFWLDEIWSLEWARSLNSPIEIFTGIHFDINHWLYTYFLYISGDQPCLVVYRIPALVAGIITVAIIYPMHHYHTKVELLTAVLMIGTSYLMTVYSSEARGYAFAVLFALLSFYLMRDYLNKKKWQSNVLFCLAAVLGLSSHLTFIFPYAAILLWSLLAFIRKQKKWRDAIIDSARCHAVPCVFFALLYFLDIRHIRHGGATVYPLADVLCRTVTLTVGGPTSSPIAAIISLGCAALVVIEIIKLWREKSDLWIFYLTLFFLGPACVILVSSGDFSYWLPRHFIVCVPFFILLLARFLSSCYHYGKDGKIIYATFLMLYCAGNTVRISEFLKDGRGHYLAAVKYMAEKTENTIITAGSDHDFRNRMMLNFYSRYLPGDKHIIYVNQNEKSDKAPEWYIMHDLEKDFVPEPVYVDSENRRYILAKSFRYSGISGWHWFIYHLTTNG